MNLSKAKHYTVFVAAPDQINSAVVLLTASRGHWYNTGPCQSVMPGWPTEMFAVI